MDLKQPISIYFLLAVLSSCGQNSPRHSEYGGSFFMPPKDPNALVLYDVTDPPTLDPARSWGFFDGRIIGLIFSKLVRFNPKADIVPDLAENWQISDDGTTYTFHLNPNARFSFGRPVTAEDVKFSFERVMDPDTAAPNQWVFEPVDRIAVVDRHTLQIHLNQPFAPFLGTLAMPAASIVPKEKLTSNEQLTDPFGEHPIGSGPWGFEEWQHDQYIRLSRNETYWANKPSMPNLTFRIINNPFTAIAEFETGNLAVILPLPIAEILRWKEHPKWGEYLFQAPLLNTDMLLFNCEKAPFDKRENRLALALALDMPLLLEGIREGAGRVSSGPVPSGIKGHTPSQSPHPYDPKKARAIVRNSELANHTIKLLLPSTEGFTQTIGEVVQAEWKKIGLDVDILKMEWVTYRKMLREGDFHIAFRGWFADYPDGDNFLYPLFHSSQIGSNNFSRFSNLQVDRLIEQEQNELDPQRRVQLLKAADDAIYEQVPALFLWHRSNFGVRQPWVSDYQEPLIFNGTHFLDVEIVKPKLN